MKVDGKTAASDLDAKEAQIPPIRYVEQAEVMNEIAGELLNIKTRSNIENFRAKVAMGLSFQAAEVAAKGILRAFGQTGKQIQKAHRNHELLKLLDDVEERIFVVDKLIEFRDFLSRPVTVRGKTYHLTTRDYLEGHFEHGAGATPRSYFYPDTITWTGPEPIDALYWMVEEILKVAAQVVEILDPAALGGQNK